MRKSVKIIGLIAAVAAFFVLSYVLYQQLTKAYKPQGERLATPAAQSAAPADDQTDDADNSVPAPDFTVLDTQGNSVKLSDYFGRPIVLNFWASWCPPCKGEMPDFQTVFEEMGTDVQFLMVNMTDGSRETVDTAKAFLDTSGYTFPVLFDTQQDAAYQYGVSSIPTTLFIDTDGNVVAGAEGAVDEATLRKGIGMIAPAE
ncbi:MAG: TlpA disulfide reductase family protein [Eubacteriales bacterium]|nr:TlpA disulfide reductase family protein [Eubacteriales bacterium]